MTTGMAMYCIMDMTCQCPYYHVSPYIQMLVSASCGCRTTLHLAVSEGQLDVVVVLLDKGARVDIIDNWGNTPLHDALSHNQFAIAQKLVAKGAKVAKSQFALVMDAAQNDFAQLSLMCQRAGVDANSADYDARSVLHVACSSGDLKAVQNLLRVGASVNIKDRCVTVR
jgi:potassium channel